MTRVFLDSSVLMSAILSHRGSARDILLYAEQLGLQLLISPLVIKEVTRNIHKKRPDKLHLWKSLLTTFNFSLVEPSLEEVRDAAHIVVAKDAPILAAAIHSKCAYLATYDDKHLLQNRDIAGYTIVRVTTPDVILAALNEKVA